MNTLLVSDAVMKVRKNLDEQGLNDSVMYTDEGSDNTSMDQLIAKTLPEAINAVHRAAPAHRLEGEDVRSDASISVSEGVVLFSLPAHVLRITALRAVDSEIVVTDILSEASAEGRKQLNPYFRGTYDRPRLVRVQHNGEDDHFRYYSLAAGTASSAPIAQLDVIYEQKYTADATSYKVSVGLKEAVIAQLTGMVLAIYGETDKAQYFITQASSK